MAFRSFRTVVGCGPLLEQIKVEDYNQSPPFEHEIFHAEMRRGAEFRRECCIDDFEGNINSKPLPEFYETKNPYSRYGFFAT